MNSGRACAWIVGAITLIGLPAHARQAPQAVPKDSLVIHSHRLRSGVPLGGIGCGSFQILTDGSISRSTINNNLLRPSGDLRGCFAALWTSAGGKVGAKALKLKSEYGLPAVGALDYTGNYPVAQIAYPDSALPVEVSLKALSPLIPHDLRNSSLPVVLFTFTLKNVSRAPVTASIAFSWENFLGVGGGPGAGFSDRLDTEVASIPADGGLFGMAFSGPPLPAVAPENRLPYNARGNYALLAQPGAPDVEITTAGWNTLDARPGWWQKFEQSGTVVGDVGAGREGSVHPAGVVALKANLKDGETREFAFAIAWYTPRFYTLAGEEYGHYYEKSFPDSTAVARYALENRLNLSTLTEEWHSRLTHSSLPGWISRALINDASLLSTHTVLTRDSSAGVVNPGPSLFGMVANVEDRAGFLGGLSTSAGSNVLLGAFFPEMAASELRGYASAAARTGLTESYGSLTGGFTSPPVAVEGFLLPQLATRTASFAYHLLAHARLSGSQALLDMHYPAVKRSIEAILEDPAAAKSGDGIVMVLGRRLAEEVSDSQFAARCLEAEGAVHAGSAWMLRLIHPTSTAKIAAAVGAQPTSYFGAMTSAVAALREGRADAALRLVSDARYSLEESAKEPWAAGSAEGRVPGGLGASRATLEAASSWLVLGGLLGFDYDGRSQALVLNPSIPTAWKSLSAPTFAPGFWAWLEAKPSAARTFVSFRIDRMMPLQSDQRPDSTDQPRLPGSAGLALKSVVLPAHGLGACAVTVSLGRSPVPGTVSRDQAGRVVFTFESPVKLVPGSRIQFEIRSQPSS